MSEDKKKFIPDGHGRPRLQSKILSVFNDNESIIRGFLRRFTSNAHDIEDITQSAIWPYLYGSRVDWEMLNGTLVVRSVPVESFTYNGKVVPAGFFDLPGAENVSAVLFSNAGTLAKFDRMKFLR